MEKTLITAPIADALTMKRRGLTLGLLSVTYFFSYMDRQLLLARIGVGYAGHW